MFLLRQWRACTALIVLFSPGMLPLGAQAPRLEPGMRIRVGSRGAETVGTLLLRTADSVVLRKGDSSIFSLPAAAIRKLEISGGKSRLLGASRGATIGGTLFLIVSVGQAAIDSSLCPSCRADVRDAGGSVKFVTSGVAAGAVFGGLIGALVGTERWMSADEGWRVALDVRERRLLLAWRRR